MNDPNDVRLTGTCIADLITGINVAVGILAGLVGRSRAPEGAGVQIDTSVFEAVSTLTIDAMTQAIDNDQDPVRVTRHPQAQNFCLKTASGGWIVLHLSSSEKFWQSLMRAIGRADLIDDSRFQGFVDRMDPERFAAIKQILEQAFAQKPQEVWERILAEADVPYAPTLTMREVAAQRQTQWLQLLDWPSDRRVLVRPPWRFDATRPSRSRRVPHVGEHTREILSELRSTDELDLFIEKGTIFQADMSAL